MSAIIMIPTITIVALVTLYLIGTIIFYIGQKPVANQSSFDIVALHLAWTTLHIGRSDPFDFLYIPCGPSMMYTGCTSMTNPTV